MAITRTKLHDKTEAFDTDYEGEPLHIVYRPGAMTPGWWDRLYIAPARQVLAEVLVDWDVLDEDGTPFVPAPITDLPVVNTAQLGAAIAQELTPEQIGNATDSGVVVSQLGASIAQDLTPAQLGAALDSVIKSLTPTQIGDEMTRRWSVLLSVLPQEFVAFVVGEIHAQVRPGKRSASR